MYLTSGSISAFFKRFHVASLLKSSNIRKARGTSPARILEYMFTLIFEVQRSFSTVKLEIIIRTCYLISCYQRLFAPRHYNIMDEISAVTSGARAGMS